MRRIYTAAAITAFTMIVGSASWSLGDNPIINEGSIGDCSIAAVDNGRDSYVTISSSQGQIDKASVGNFGDLNTWNQDAEDIELECNLDVGSVTLINPMSSKPEYQGIEYHTTTEGYGLYYDDGITSTFYGIGDPPASAVGVALTASPASGAANEFTVTALFGEDVIGFTASDVTVTNGTVSEFSGNGNEYSFVVTPSADGAVTVNIAAEAATAVSDSDIKSAAAAQLSLTGDVTAPFGYFVSLDQDTINTGNDEAVSFTFAGAEVGTTYSYKFSSSGGGTPVTGGGTISTATDQITGIDVSGLGDGTLTLDVVLTDAAGNRGDTTTDTATKDTTAPTGHSVAFTQNGVNASNETAIGFRISNADDVDYSYTISSDGGGTDVTGSGTISGGSETVTGLDLSGLEDGTLTLSVVLTDAVGNAAAAVEDSVSKDGNVPDAPNAPTLADSSNSGITTDTLTNDTTATITGTAEANATVTVYVGATEAGTTSADGSGNWSFTFEEGDLASGANSITSTATDAAGNISSASSALIITTDQTGPSVVLTSNANVPHSGLFTVTATFSEAVTGFELTDVVVGNGTASNLSGSGAIYTFDVTPTSDGAVTVDIAADKAADAATNGNAAATQLSVTTDQTGPSVVLTSNANVPHSGLFTVTATFSEAVTGFELTDVVVGNGTASNLSGSGAVYTFDVTPSADGAVTVDIAANAAQDAATNGNTVATQLSVTTDQTGPTVTLTSDATDPHSGKFSVTATFSEEVTGFALADITVGNGTASNLAGSGKVYTFDVTPSGDGKVTVDVAADVAEDAASNKNSAASQLNVTTDSTAPTITITGPTDVVTDDFTVTVTFSEEVTGFEKGDITVTNGTEGDFKEVTAGTVYTLVVTPDLGSTVSISIAADAAQDAAGNGNTAPDAFTVQAGSPASEFEAKKVEVSKALVEEAQRSTVSMVTSNVRLTQEARGRFIRNLRQSASGFVGDNNVAFGMTADGRAASGGVISTKGKFFQQTGNDEGTYRRVFFGDFDVQSDKESGSTTATLSGKLAWERMTSETTMVGYFIGLDVGRADLDGTFKGDQKSAGLQLGTYVVKELEKNLYLDGFLTIGGAKNQLAMTNGVLDVESDYISKTASVGGAITGVVEQPGYEIWPELALTVGHTKLGTIDFTGRAYGLVDNSLSLDAGDVTAANLTFRPEVRVPADGRSMEDSRTLVTFAPRAICESVKTTVTEQDCGFGSEFGFTTRSKSGLTNLKARVTFDKVGTSVRRGLQVKLEHRF